MSDADRERELRRLDRDRLRRERGAPTFFAPSTLLGVGPDDPTVNLRPEAFRAAAAAADGQPSRRRLGTSTAIFGAATGLSRVLGLVREVIASYYFGTAGKINAFTVAFQFPNLVRALVADAALSSAFVPVFVDLLKKDPKRAWRVASSLFWLMLLGLTALSALFILISPWVIGIFGNPGHDPALAVGLSRVLFPIVALLGVSGIIVGILNSYDHFTVPAISPVFWNIAIIVGLAIGVPQAHTMSTKLYVYAVSILIATFIQAFLPLPWLRGYDGRLRLALDWHDPAVKEVFRNMIPVTLGLGLININAVIDMLFASRYIDPDLAPTAIQKAFLIYMLPQGMFSVAIATVLFPTLSRHASDARESGDFSGFRNTVGLGLRCLAAFSAGLVFNGAMLMLNRGFFSLRSNWIPTWIALGNLGLNAVLDFALYRVGIWGIPLATAICNIAGTWALLVVLRRRIHRIDGRAIASTTIRIVAASAAVGVVAWVIWHPLDSALGRSFPAQVVSLGCALSAAILVYFLGCRLLKVRELDALLALRTRLRRA